MARILIAYASDKGATARLAEALAEGARESPSTTVHAADVDALCGEDVLQADGVLFGSPVHMGAMHWRAKRFIDQQCGPLWRQVDLSDRHCGVFATGGGYGGAGGGADLAMLAMLSNFAQLGMAIVPLPRATPGFAEGGCHWGPYARTNAPDGTPVPVPEGALTCARRYGFNFAERVAAVREVLRR
ncbi:MAG: flavodoxin family protein [Marivibrio sp.]